MLGFANRIIGGLFLVLFLAIENATALPTISWDTPAFVQKYDSLINGVSIAYDSANHPHVSYVSYSAGNILKYAHFDGVNWVVESLNSVSVMSSMDNTSIQIDSAGYPHIACTGRTSDYVYKDAGGWHYEDIADAVVNPSLRIGTDGKSRVTYYDTHLAAYRYSVRTAGVWASETIAAYPGVPSPEWCSLALDAANGPRVSFCDDVNSDLKYAYKTGSAWIVLTLDSGSDLTGYRNDIEMDASGYPHIAYTDGTAGKLRHVWLTASGWNWEEITTGSGPESLDIDISTSGTIGVGTSTGSGVTYAHKTSAGSWIVDTTSTYFGNSVAFAYNNTGSPFLVSGGDGTTDYHSLYYIAYASGKPSAFWTYQLIDSGGDFGSFGVGASKDGHWVTYGVTSLFQLRVADPQTYGYGVADVGPGSYRYADIDSSSGGTVYISYYSDTDTSLRVAEGPQAPSFVWNTWTTVDNSANVGQFTSIAYNAITGYPHVSYYDVTNGDLKHAWKDAGGWHTEAVDTTGMVGWDSSIAIISAGIPRISYYDSTNSALKFAYKTGATWFPSTVDNTASVGEYSACAYDLANVPHVSYYDRTNDRLKYAKGPIGSWTIEYPDPGVGVGKYTSIATDYLNRPHISYYDSTNGNLKHAWFDGTVWRVATLDSSGSVGQNTAIGIDGSRIRIYYYDATTHRVKYIAGWVDYTAPSTPVVVDDGDYTTSATQLHATWSSTDAESGVSTYEYAIGTTPADPGSGYTVGWTSAGVGVTKAGLSLINGQVYYFYVRARNNAGEYSAVGVSNGIRIVKSTGSIGQTKLENDGTWVQLTSKLISRAPSLYYTYIQEPNRSSGMQLYSLVAHIPASTLAVGDSVTVTGVLSHTLGQSTILEPVIQKTGSGASVVPMYVRNKYVGGGPFHFVAGPPASGELGTSGSAGLNNIGLLLTTSGRVLSVSPSEFEAFVITDGSLDAGLRISQFTGEPRPAVGDFVKVIGHARYGDLYLVSGGGGWVKLD